MDMQEYSQNSSFSLEETEPLSQTFSSEKMEMPRFFTQINKDPFKFDIFGNPINWITEDISVTDDMGKTIFTQPNIKRPDTWSLLAMKVVSNKYFWGDQSKGEREDGVDKLIGRVSRFVGRQAKIQGYFNDVDSKTLQDEISAICLNQLCVFNSPVWFNAGILEYNKTAGGIAAFKWDDSLNKAVKTQQIPKDSKNVDDRPQCSACFIQGVHDDMDEIMQVQVAEANLFKAGSGTGSNRSALRSSKEKLTGGGMASGPVSFMKGYDAYAGIIKSGGKTRRAAKMEILNIDHPDIIDFIESKQKEERKAWALIEQGYDGGMNGEAYASVAFQNCNMSVRINDKFMEAVKSDSEWVTKMVKDGSDCETFKAKDLINKIAEGTHTCGDPGIQNDSIINKYNTCKNSGRINASNPCSEYIFLDDTACNLSSINLLKFLKEDGTFDVESFRKVVHYFIISMDLLVDGASYPTMKITERSHKFRTLGLGYANLGALLMSLGLPYGSDEGRSVAASITAIMCGEAYKISAKLSRMVGPFPEYQKNRDSMLEVIGMHRDHVKEIDVEKIPSNLRYLVNDAWDCWSEALELGEKYGYRNAQTTVLAPTGTIAFMMDCETTGIEPDIALVKYKVLSGGGMLKIVNRAVPIALARLGYSEQCIKEISEYIDKNETIEGAPNLREEHLSIFDCAFKPAKGERAIGYEDHIKMMAVTQPFISGAISKTVNMPEESSIEDIVKAYIFSWEQGLKAVAIYRENSKRSQPLNTQKTEGEIVRKTEKKIGKLEKTRLPQTRKSITHKFNIAGHKGFITVGLFSNNKPGEVFITMHKQGSTIRGLMDAWARSISMNLQYGASVHDLFTKFRYQKFEPAGFVKNNTDEDFGIAVGQIRTASSIVDYVAQFMLNNFGDGSGGIEFDVKTNENSNEEQASLDKFHHEGLTCSLCGGPAKRIGNCSIMCNNCNQTIRSGCGE